MAKDKVKGRPRAKEPGRGSYWMFLWLMPRKGSRLHRVKIQRCIKSSSSSTTTSFSSSIPHPEEAASVEPHPRTACSGNRLQDQDLGKHQPPRSTKAKRRYWEQSHHLLGLSSSRFPRHLASPASSVRPCRALNMARQACQRPLPKRRLARSIGVLAHCHNWKYHC